MRQRREAGAARRGARAPRRQRARAPHRRVVAGARAHRAAADRASARLGRRTPVDLRGGPAPRRRGARRRRADARPLPRVEHRQFRRAGRRRFPAAHPRARSRPATSCSSAPTSSSPSAICCSPTTIRSASRRRSTRTSSCASTASSAATSTSPRSIIARSGTPSDQPDRDAPGQPRRPVGADRGRGCHVPFAAGEHIWTESSYKYDARRHREIGRETGFATREQWIDAQARFALTLLGAI